MCMGYVVQLHVFIPGTSKAIVSRRQQPQGRVPGTGDLHVHLKMETIQFVSKAHI